MRSLILKLKLSLPYLFLLAEVLVFFRQALFWHGYFIPFDLRGYHYPMAWFAVENLGMGRLPLWDPYTYCGFPFYANIQAQLFYPPAWPAYAIAALYKIDLLFKLMEWQTVLHIFLGGALAYRLLTRLGLGRGSAIFGATIFQLGGFFSSQTQHLGMVCGSAWMPLAWMAVFELGRRFSWKWMATLACALALSLLAGFPATAIVVFGSTVLLACLLTVFRHAGPRVILWTAAACFWAVLLSAVQVLPTANLAALSTASLRGQWYVGGGVPLQALVSLIIPNYHHIFEPDLFKLPYNLTFLYIYCGIPGLALAIGAAFFSRHKLSGVAVSMTILCLLWTLGSFTPGLGRLYRFLPGAIRAPMYPELAMAAFVLAMGVLAAMGAEKLVAPRGKFAMAGLVLLAAADLTAFGSGRYMNTTRIEVDPGVTPTHVEGSAECVARLRALTAQSYPRARFDIIKDYRNWACSPQILHLPTASGEQPLALLRILKLRRGFSDGPENERYFEVSKYGSKILDIMSIRYLLAFSFWGEPVVDPQMPRLENAGPHIIYENPDAAPRFFLVGGIRQARDLNESLTILTGPDFDPAREAVVEGGDDVNVAAGPQPPGRVKVTRHAPDRVTLEVDANAPAFLVTSETFYPGWRASVNGREERIRMTNAAFRGFPVPAGHSQVTMTFRPPDLLYGALLSALACALLVWAVCAPRRRGA